MADVTDIAFRQNIARWSRHGERGGGPDIFFTEFVSADGLHSEKGRPNLIKNLLQFDAKIERPIVAQIFGAKPDRIYATVKIIKKLKFNGVDINMGCPDKKVEKQGAGAALIKSPKLAREIIRAAQEAAGDMPVSVKTRIGYNKDILEEWMGELLEEKLAALTIHARTRKEMSNVPADWAAIKRAVKLARNHQTLIVGNGDVYSIQDGLNKARESGADGVMVGRGVFGRPWFFDKNFNETNITPMMRVKALIDHLNLFEAMLVDIKNYAIMKKHFKAYIGDFKSSKDLRIKLMNTKSVREARIILENYAKSN